MALSLVYIADFHNIVIESVAVDGFVSNLVAVGIYGVYRVAEEVGNFVGIIDAESQESEYAQFHGERVRAFYLYALFRAEQSIKFIHEVGIEV